MRLPEDGLARASSLSESPEIDLIGTPEAPISEATAEALRYHPVIILSVPKKGDASEPKLVTFAVVRRELLLSENIAAIQLTV